MNNTPAHSSLKELLAPLNPAQPAAKPFPIGVELVSTRGSTQQNATQKVRDFAAWLAQSLRIDWISITDNAGGNPQLAPAALGLPVLAEGKEVVVHLTCKDMNRAALESQLWMLASHGFHNILALTGDFPLDGVGDTGGRAKPVFDIDSVGLLTLIKRLNEGLVIAPSSAKNPEPKRLEPCNFFAGAVVSPFKQHENTLFPQYAKLEQKIHAGAQSVTNQIGFDSRKCSELLEFMRLREFPQPLIGNVYLLTPFVARLFREGRIPGVSLSAGLFELCEKQRSSPDRGKAFFLEFAAKQLAIYRGLGYRAGYLGGVHTPRDVEAVLDLEASFAPDDWRQFAKEIQFSNSGEFYLFEQDEETRLARPGELCKTWRASLEKRELLDNVNITPLYHLSQLSHRLMFEKGRALAPLGAAVCRRAQDPAHGPLWLRGIEHASKTLLFSCQECGDCSLFETGYLCPESQCAKNQRNGPCGGSREGACAEGRRSLCEVLAKECIWARAYDRAKAEGCAERFLEHAPVLQNQTLRDTSSWANFWLGRDHANGHTSEEGNG